MVNVGRTHSQTAPLAPDGLQQQRPRSQTLQSAQTLIKSHNSLASASRVSVAPALPYAWGYTHLDAAEFTHNNCAGAGAGAGTRYSAAHPPVTPEFKLVQVNAKMWDEAANLALPTSNLGYGSATAATAATGTAPPSVASGAGASEFKQVLVNAKMWDKLWDESVTATASIVAATASIVDALTRGQESAKLLAVASSRAVASSSPVSSTSAMAAANKGSPLLAVQIPGAAHELDGSGATGFNLGASDGAGVCLPVDAPVHFPFLDPF